uniref:Helicase-like transcription factor n=1 Tax=Sinocyclocheilus grahami TaxID=75366 RepID=A0A672QBN6_SINGR
MTISQEIANLTEDSGQDLPEENVQIGSIQGTVVGLRYYTGTVNRGEMVSLVRQPQNPYDRNAVMVANVYGSQVGHIKKELAAPMAYIMGNNLARVEGYSNFSVSFLQICYLLEENREAVHNQMRCHGFKLGTKFKGSLICLFALKNAFDKLFDDLMEDKTREMEPAGAVCTSLLPHQKQALSWMTSRENSNDLPPFWEEKNGLYFNVLTNFAVKERPEKVLGGILADDMGLGKTLTTIALIVSNFHSTGKVPSGGGGGSGVRATLIVCPLSVLSNWLDQFEQHIRADVTLKVYLYYGAEQEVVLTTYNVLSSDYGNSPLHKVNWLRVVLDEGHIIRNPNALQSKAILELQSERMQVDPVRHVHLGGYLITPLKSQSWIISSFLCALRTVKWPGAQWCSYLNGECLCSM